MWGDILNKTNSTIDIINVIGCIADLKEVDYKNTLTLSAILELLFEKKIINKDEFEKMYIKLNSKID